MLRGAVARRVFQTVSRARLGNSNAAAPALRAFLRPVRATTPGITAAASAAAASSASSGVSSTLLAVGGGGVCALAGYSAYDFYQQVEAERAELARAEAERDALAKEEELALRPEAEYEHPHNALPWYRRLFKTMGRILYLSYLFVPCTALGLVTSLSSDTSWRQYFINYLVRTMEAAGSTFQKYGQWISNRPDIFPPDVIAAMKGLCTDAPVHGEATTREEIRRSFGCEVEDLFEEFDWTPVASGTIAQVHRAKLKPEHALSNGSREVAVKVRHPEVLDETFVDAGILFGLVATASRFSRAFCVPFQEAEFTHMVQKQTNLKWEAYNIWRFRNNFRECRAASRNGSSSGSSSGGVPTAAATVAAAAGSTADALINDATGTDRRRPADDATANDAAATAVVRTRTKDNTLQASGIGRNQVQFPSIDVRHVSNSVLIEEWVQGKSVQTFFEEVGEGFHRTAREVAETAAAAVAKVAGAPAALATAAETVVAAPAAAVEKAAKLTSETKHRIASAVLHSAFHMFFRDNLVHGDLHGGNVLYDEENGRVTLIDAGITTALGSKETTDDFLCFLHGMSVGDAEILTDTLLRLSTLNTDADSKAAAAEGDAAAPVAAVTAATVPVDLDAVPQRAQLKAEVEESCRRWIDLKELERSGQATAPGGGPVPVGDLMGDLLQCMARNDVQLRGDVATTVVTIAMCEGLVRQLDPQIDMLVESVPYIRKYCDYETLAKFV